jgi:hypothetical protein
MKAHYIKPVLIVVLFTTIVVSTIVYVIYGTRENEGVMIATDIAQLATIFNRINTTCGIIGFDHQKNPINFLNVTSFVGSEVGPMNLKYPQKWQGPYLPNNPTMQAIEYQIVRTDRGYFITPGDGVKLPNGKIVGKDIILDEHAHIVALMADSQGLMFEEQPLAAPLHLHEIPVPQVMIDEGDDEL